jgi:hypothetical protein
MRLIDPTIATFQHLAQAAHEIGSPAGCGLTAGDPDGSGNGRRVPVPPIHASPGVQIRFMRGGTFPVFNSTLQGVCAR